VDLDYEAENKSPRQSAEEPEKAVENWGLVRNAPFPLGQLQGAGRNRYSLGPYCWRLEAGLQQKTNCSFSYCGGRTRFQMQLLL